ncbi:sterol carrier family protein [Streptomyces niveiscabiei]|uniref:maleylpyruvate isomerase family mycothiol-dependent enzyme n=1 Tax=Streptomyces niveiscabiei TaxID=164115 RepID=UPI0029A28CD5|nr:sterol carrier family protein [Streptomyces niveiscabiei]MDX3385410.1 sterol carrier family protein [Streptomyces niveiscabiei]
MPPKKRPRAYDPTKTRTAILAQLAHLDTATRSLTDGDLARPTRLGDWTVRELVAHIGMAVTAVGRALALPEPPKQDATLLDWPFATAGNATAIDEFTKNLAQQKTDLAAAARALAEQLDTHPATRLLQTNAGAMPLAEYLVTRTVELIVHTDDLNAALPATDIPYDRQALAAATRLLADALAGKAPGGSTEVRVPPFAVVQAVQGPRHTRGTPPNVVETDPLTWIRLATGRLTWEDALNDATLTASGERADLTPYLPVMS